MSLSWRNEVRIGLSPDRVTLARVSRRWRAKVIAKHAVQCVPAEPADWRPCIEALQQSLKEPAWQDADASVVISNHFVRYAVVPWSEHLATDEEKAAWVRHHFLDLYGEPGEPAEYRWSADRPDAPGVASAVDREFMKQLRAAFEPTALRLRSVQPYLMAVFNRWKRRVKDLPAWIVLPEGGRICIAAVANGKWRTITSRSIGPDWKAEVTLTLERELLLSDGAPGLVLAYGPGAPDPDLASVSDVPVTLLVPRRMSGYSPQSDADYTMALTGAV